MFCLPVVKQEADRLAIRQAAVSGDPRFFFGSDSAPHRLVDKEKADGAAGIFNMSTALPSIVQVFEAEESIDNLEAFLSLNGARFYGLPLNPDTITLKKAESPIPPTDYIPVGKDKVKVFQTREPLFWRVVEGLRQTGQISQKKL
jgi:dihydroorotase